MEPDDENDLRNVVMEEEGHQLNYFTDVMLLCSLNFNQ